MKKIYLGLMAILLSSAMILTACGDDEENEYAIDMQQLANTLPGKWSIDEATMKSTAGNGGRIPVTDMEIPIDGYVIFDSFTFHVYDMYGQDYSHTHGEGNGVGTYKLGNYYIALQHNNGKKDTLQIANVDRNTYKTMKLRRKVDQNNVLYIDISKK